MANSVQTNISAINANRNFGITKGTLKSSTEKLSSGFKINRAADDAAGLAISEKMRRQIRGLTQASANAQDGISSVQTAEGALTEVHAMLQRMDELATKASNGSNSKDDRQFVQDELDQLMTEIDRVAETTKFNETYLLKGKADKSTTTKTLSAKDAGIAGTLTDEGGKTAEFKLDAALIADKSKITIAGKEYKIVSSNDASYAKASGTVASASMVRDANGVTRKVVTTVSDSATEVESSTKIAPGDTLIDASGKETIYTKDDPKTLNNDTTDAAISGGQVGSIKEVLSTQAKTATPGNVTITHKDGSIEIYKLGTATEGTGDPDTSTAGTKDYSGKGTYSVDDIFSKLSSGDTVKVNSKDYSIVGTNKELADDELTAQQAYDKIGKELVKANSIGSDKEVTVTSDGTGKFVINKGEVTVKKSLDFNLHVGADADMTNKINVTIDTMDTKGLGISGLNVVDDDGTKATYALDSIEAAIKTVSTQRSALGAAQNRLEHTIKNVDNVVENTTSAESSIRDTDMATEMVKFSNANILAQAGQSMLAQANQQNQGILSLLG